MDNDAFAALCRELTDLIDLGPGENKAARSRAKAAIFKIKMDADANAYVREKAIEAEGNFEVWFSTRRWNKEGDGGTRIRSFLHADISKLRGAWNRVHPAE